MAIAFDRQSPAVSGSSKRPAQRVRAEAEAEADARLVSAALRGVNDSRIWTDRNRIW